MYWPHFLKFNSMRFIVLLLMFIVFPFPAFERDSCSDTGCAVSLKFISSGNAKELVVISLDQNHEYLPISIWFNRLALIIKLALCYVITAFIFYYDSHRLTEDRKVNVDFKKNSV